MAESGFQYLKSPAGILKILEFIVLLIAIGAVGYFLKELTGDYKKKEYIEFFLAVAVVAGSLAIFFFVMFISGLIKKLKAIKWPLTVTILFSIVAIVLLVASSLLAHTVKYYDDNSFCKLLEIVDEKAQCKFLTVGTVCGFIAAALLIADAIVHFKM